VNEAIAEYTRPLGSEAKLEAGYTLTQNRLDTDFAVAAFDAASNRFGNDAAKSNRFHYRDAIHAFYVTYGRSFGKLGFLAGLRPEFTTVKSHLVNTNVTIPSDYSRIYPSLHLAYKLAEKHELQWNYSHRIHRPESDELNPFPEYADPFNLREGNPKLLPEDVHSVEAGYSFTDGDTSFTSTVYHRYLYHGFTSITRDIGGGVLLTTRENLSENRSTGLEFTANTELGKLAALNFSANGFSNTLDASNLGYSANKSDFSWIAKLGATLHLPRSTTLQLNANYSSARLTAQGERLPSFVANLGLRHDFRQKKAAIVLTVSDLFNSLKEASRIDTPLLRQEVDRRRSARVVYLGMIYNFGKPVKQAKDDPMKFDNSL
jgi:outer membrane receptor protein involved in Fe transport